MYGIVGRKRTRGDRAGGDGVPGTANERAGMGGTGGSGNGAGGAIDAADLAGGVGLSNAGSGREDDDGDIVDGGNRAGVRDGSRDGRRWLPSESILPSSSLFPHVAKVGYNS